MCLKPLGRALFGGLQDRFQAEIAVADDHIVHRGDPLILVAGQRLDRIALGHQRCRQHAAINHRLRAGLRADRLHRMRGIADQRDAAEAPARDRIAVDVRQLQHVGGRRRREQAVHVEPGVAPALELIDASLLVGGGVPGLERRRTRWDLGVGEPVDHHLAARPMLDRIKDRPVIPVANHRHRRAGEIGRGLDDAAVVQIAVEHRLLVRIEVLAHRGMDAVGADQDVACGLADGPA